MVDKPVRTLEELVASVGSFSDQAFLFVRDGLSFAATQAHGEETDAHRLLNQYLADSNLDWNDLVAKYYAGELAPFVADAIDASGGCEKLNRHISGRELCWSLRDYALKRWGMLARTVLGSWNVKSTRDFGRIVYGFIEFDMMQQQPGDKLEDFDDIYSFEEAFDETFRLPNSKDDNY